ncbi:insulinase family protein [Vibrio sp. SCSIO 43140]|nr:M16 family metallopeptidase [Vibrio sp. SCSIO 43140]USD63352.1 insulinase family protein [Vibrio sp. SCSIO 43140]
MIFSHRLHTPTVKLFLLATLALIQVASFSAHAHIETPDNQTTLWFEKSDLPLDEKLHVKALGNGMRVIVIANDKPKKAVSIRMRVAAGSLQEPGQEEPGLAHFLEHMAFNGSTNVPEGEMVQILERHGLSFGKDTNAETNFKQTVYMLELPKNDVETLKTSLFIMRETASELTLDKEAIERELPVISSEVRERTTLDLNMLYDWSSFVLRDGNIIERIPLGTLNGMKMVDKQRLTDFYRHYYTPENTTLIISGDVDVQQTFAMVEKQFGDWRVKGKQPEAYSKQVTLPSQPEARVFLDVNARTTVELNFLEPINREPDSKSKRSQELTLYIANQALQYRLETQSYASEGKLLSPYVGSYNQFDVIAINQLSMTTPYGLWREGLQVLDQGLRQAAQYGFTEQEIKRQLDKYHNLLKLDAEAEDDTYSADYASKLVSDVNNSMVTTSSAFDLSLFEQDVMSQDIEVFNRAFQQHWQGKAPRIYVTERPSTGQAKSATSRDVLETYQIASAKQVSPYTPQKQAEFAYQSFGKEGTAEKLETTNFGGVTRYRFENGVYLNVKPTDYESNAVYISVRAGKGKLGLTPEEGAFATLFDAGFVAGGLEAHDINDLRSIFSGRQINANIYLTDDAIESQYRVPPQDVLDQLRVTAAFLTHPGYRASGHAFAIEHLKSIYDSYPTTPERVLGFNSGELMYQGDPRWVYPSIESVEALPLTVLQPFVERSINKGPVEVSLLGNISEQQAVDYVAQTFGALDIKAQAFIDRPVTEMKLQPNKSYTFYHHGEPNTALASGYFTLPDGSNYSDVVGFAILRSILQIRVNDAIRESTGKAYSPWVDSSQSLLYKDYGYLNLNSNTTIENVDVVLNIYKQLVKDLQEKGVTQDELVRAVTPMTDRVEQSYESNGFWFGLMAQASSYPENLANEANFEAYARQVSVEDIQKLANRIDVSSMIEVRVLPTTK